MNIDQVTQANGLETLFVQAPGHQTATLQFWFHAGSALEAPADFGVAHFLEHMFFKGTKRNPGAKIAQKVEALGGEINAFTSFDYTCYYINCPITKLNPCLDILLDMVANPQFLAEDFVMEREVVLEEFRRSADNPNQFGFTQLQKNCFAGKYAHQILGTRKTITNFTREQVINFRKNYYNIQNAVLVIGGDVKNKATVSKKIADYKFPSGLKSQFPKFKLKTEAKTHFHDKEVNQTSITFCIQAPDYLEAAAEDLALNCLFYGENSPVYQHLVIETGLASNLSASTMYFTKEGVHFVKLTLPAENIAQALKEFNALVAQYLKSGFEDSDVQRMKNQYISSKTFEKESIESFAFSVGHSYVQRNDLASDDKFIQLIRNTSTGQINKALIDLFMRPIHVNVQQQRASEHISKQKQVIENSWKKLSSVALKIKRPAPLLFKNSAFDPKTGVLSIKPGVDFLYRRNEISPTFVLHAYIKGGLNHENSQNNGIYSLLAKTLTYGYKGMQYRELKKELELKSAYLSGFSGKNAYGLTLHGLSEHFTRLSELFFGTLLTPSFPNKFVELEKELTIRQLGVQEKDPLKQAFREFSKMVFGVHPYSMNVMGTQATVKKLKSRQLASTHQNALNREKIVFTYCGSDDEHTVSDILLTELKKLKPRKESRRVKAKIAMPSKRQVALDFDREQSQLVLGRPAFPIGTTEDLYLKMLTTFLSGQGSDLFVITRDKLGLCYAVQAVHHSAVESGYWGIYIGTSAEKEKLAMDSIEGLLKKLSQKGISASQLKKLKDSIEGQNLLAVQTNDDYANFYSIPQLHGLGLDFQHTSLQKIREVQLEKFNKFLRTFLNYDWLRVKAGPKRP